MSRYLSLAPVYDALTRDVDRSAFADFYVRMFASARIPVRMVLDLACGTGTITKMLAERGYEMIGADASGEMLVCASEKCDALPPERRPLFLQQSMQRLDLYGTVDAAVCALDGLNYVPPGDLSEVLRRLHLFIAPGGMLIFDVNTPHKLSGLSGGLFVDETEDVYCVMRTEYDVRKRSCFYGLDLFTKKDGAWERGAEEHVEYAYAAAELRRALRRAGFGAVRAYSGRDFGPRRSGDERAFYTAIRI